jgi:Zn-dependent M32 family carboxypeptidase
LRDKEDGLLKEYHEMQRRKEAFWREKKERRDYRLTSPDLNTGFFHITTNTIV